MAEQLPLLQEQPDPNADTEKAERAEYRERLRQKLQEPEFRQIEGFPIGEDEDILALSEPPYYTACPKPWIADFIKETILMITLV